MKIKKIEGKFTNAELFLSNNKENNIDDYALTQIQMLCDNQSAEGCRIRVMPDVHPGKGCTIGMTMTIGEKLMPNIVGIDIGCGMRLAKLKSKKVEFQKLDTVIRENIPSGFSIRGSAHRYSDEIDLSELHCYKHINEQKALCSLGTLGGGNHFIELDKDEAGDVYVIIHSGSRHLGLEVTDYYLHRGNELLKQRGEDVPFELTYLEGELLQEYIDDLLIIQKFAKLNRAAMMIELVKGMKFKVVEEYECIHNYLDTETIINGKKVQIIRKGAISAKEGEKVIIPINMRDGVILAKGRGNEEWNCSAPHGAGRIYKRSDVKEKFTVSDFKNEMKGIYSSCINSTTLDEAPFAYRSLNDIQEVIAETVQIDSILTPIYNYKAGGKK